MPIIDELKILVTAEVAKAVADLDKTQKAATKTGTSFKDMAAFMMGPVAAGKQVIAIFQQIKAVSDKMEMAWSVQEEAVAVLNSTLKATGSAAGFTSEEIQAMASEFQSFTKYGDETTLAMQNVLLGFKNIKGDNFKEASLQILNMATVMNMDLTSAAQAVGKALDDPIRGIDSLSRQGFKFSDEQKAMLKSLVETGQIAKAQGIILDELATTYGGAAEAAGNTASAIKVKLSNAIGDINEEIGRSIATSLKPWREKWLELAKAIGASAKAQNDFRDAMDRSANGTATLSDKLVVAQETLDRLKKSAGGSAMEEAYGTQAQIKAQEEVVAALKEQIRIAALYKGRTDAIAEAEKKRSDQAVKDAEKIIESEEEIVEILEDQTFQGWNLEQTAVAFLDTIEDQKEILEEQKEAVDEITESTFSLSDAWGEWNLDLEESKEIFDSIYSAASDTFSAISDLQSNQSDAYIASLEKERDQYDKNSDAYKEADDKVQAAKNAAAKKEFNANKMTQMANAIINGAVAVAEVAANPLLATVVAGLVGTQIAAIGAQQYVPFAAGGYVDQPTHALIGEAGGEWILNKTQMAGLMKNGIGGGGITVVQNIGGSIWNTKQLQGMATAAVSKASRGF